MDDDQDMEMQNGATVERSRRLASPPRGWFQTRFPTAEKRYMFVIAVATVGLTILGLVAAWMSVTLAKAQLEQQTDIKVATEGMSLATERLWLLLGAAMVENRLLLMMLCADHPNISAVCNNVSTWSQPGGYLQNGVLDYLYPPNGSELPTNTTAPEPARKSNPPTVVSTMEGAVAVTFTAFFAFLILVSVFML